VAIEPRGGETHAMENVFARPILTRVYASPDRHGELDNVGQPTSQVIEREEGQVECERDHKDGRL
jgi:hypothetical protein